MSSPLVQRTAPQPAACPYAVSHSAVGTSTAYRSSALRFAAPESTTLPRVAPLCRGMQVTPYGSDMVLHRAVACPPVQRNRVRRNVLRSTTVHCTREHCSDLHAHAVHIGAAQRTYLRHAVPHCIATRSDTPDRNVQKFSAVKRVAMYGGAVNRSSMRCSDIRVLQCIACIALQGPGAELGRGAGIAPQARQDMLPQLCRVVGIAQHAGLTVGEGRM